VNTFLPFPNLRDSADCLDNKRLPNQLNECRVIQKALAGDKAWARHPATLMWEGCDVALSIYMSCLADEMWRRGMRVPQWAPELSYGFCGLPPWFGHPAVHESHRRNLLRKNYQYYKPLFPQEVGGSDVYAWPTKQEDGTWIIRFKQVGAKNYETRTEPVLQGATHG
jgi:hypothetical protein